MSYDNPNTTFLSHWGVRIAEKTWQLDHVPAMLRMRTTDEFLDYCIEHGIRMEDQLSFIENYRRKVFSPHFSLSLREYGKVLRKALSEDETEKATDELLGDDVIEPPAASEDAVPPQQVVRRQIETFVLTEAGRKAGQGQWMKMLKGMARLGHFAPDEIARFRAVLGVALEFGRPVELTEPALFKSNKKELSFWFAMMLGAMSYITPDDGSSLDYGLGKGRYLCPQLIAAPKNNHWKLLDQCVAISGAKPAKGGSGHRSYITARKDDVEAAKACPIVRLLLPLGCKKV